MGVAGIIGCSSHSIKSQFNSTASICPHFRAAKAKNPHGGAEAKSKKLPYDLNSQAGLALVGEYLERIKINVLLSPKFPVRSGVANSDI